MTKEQMITRAVAKGHNQESAQTLLSEIYATSFGKQALIHSLLYFNFITLRQAEKMEA